MFASPFAVFLPIVFLIQCLKRIPEDLGQEVSFRDTLSAANSGEGYSKGGQYAMDDGRFASRGDAVNNYC